MMGWLPTSLASFQMTLIIIHYKAIPAILFFLRQIKLHPKFILLIFFHLFLRFFI